MEPTHDIPAFPVKEEYSYGPSGEFTGFKQHLGLNTRDYLAAAALPIAWDAFDKGYWECSAEDINRTVAESAYRMADAMLEARGRGNG